MPPPPAFDLVRVSRAHSAAGSRFVLEVDAFAVRRGEALALVGPSGAGKSTMLDLLALALKPDAAERFTLTARDGAAVDIAAAWATGAIDRLTAARAAHLGYVLQQGGLLPFLTVAENIALSQRVLGRRDPERVRTLAERLDIAALLDRKPAALSVGQRQRAAIARALAHDPEILLADEPTASVHPALADTVLALLVEQARAADAALILATHDPDRAARHGMEIVQVAVSAEGAGRSRFTRRAAAAAA
ncbi:MAG: ABC transporter ATP-binding protein [Rhodospirillaceae bacterium]